MTKVFQMGRGCEPKSSRPFSGPFEPNRNPVVVIGPSFDTQLRSPSPFLGGRAPPASRTTMPKTGVTARGVHSVRTERQSYRLGDSRRGYKQFKSFTFPSRALVTFHAPEPYFDRSAAALIRPLPVEESLPAAWPFAERKYRDNIWRRNLPGPIMVHTSAAVSLDGRDPLCLDPPRDSARRDSIDFEAGTRRRR